MAKALNGFLYPTKAKQAVRPIQYIALADVRLFEEKRLTLGEKIRQ